jgi:hypothetical protein
VLDHTLHMHACADKSQARQLRPALACGTGRGHEQRAAPYCRADARRIIRLVWHELRCALSDQLAYGGPWPHGWVWLFSDLIIQTNHHEF